MAIVHIPTPLRTLTGGAVKVSVVGLTVREIVVELDSKFPGIGARLVEDDRLRPGMAVFVDGANNQRRLRTKVGAESEVFFVESLGGGLTETPTLYVSAAEQSASVPVPNTRSRIGPADQKHRNGRRAWR